MRAEGDDGLVDRRMGRRSPRRAPEEELERMLALYRDKYADFTVKHFHEQLQKRHGYVLGYTVTKLALHASGLVRKAPKRSAHHKKRPRRPLPGMMLHQDGSRHVWLEGLPAMDLIVTLDDATSEVYSMLLVEEERTASTFLALGEVVGEHGLFCALYTDRGSHYFYTAKAGEKVSRAQQTQVGRALSHLGIEHIAAYSPQARGRSERMFGTLQGRLPKDLRLAGITTVEAANAWLKLHYIAQHNAAFAIKRSRPNSRARRSLPTGTTPGVRRTGVFSVIRIPSWAFPSARLGHPRLAARFRAGLSQENSISGRKETLKSLVVSAICLVNSMLASLRMTASADPPNAMAPRAEKIRGCSA
jgi:hypothetical protein